MSESSPAACQRHGQQVHPGDILGSVHDAPDIRETGLLHGAQTDVIPCASMENSLANQQEDIRHFKALRRQCLGQITDLENNVRTIGVKSRRFSPEARKQEIVRLRYSMTSYENWLRNNGVELAD